jgi:hypothetical protein
LTRLPPIGVYYQYLVDPGWKILKIADNLAVEASSAYFCCGGGSSAAIVRCWYLLGGLFPCKTPVHPAPAKTPPPKSIEIKSILKTGQKPPSASTQGSLANHTLCLYARGSYLSPYRAKGSDDFAPL